MKINKKKRKIKEPKRGQMREHLKEPWRPQKYKKSENRKKRAQKRPSERTSKRAMEATKRKIYIKERGTNTTINFTTLVPC